MAATSTDMATSIDAGHLGPAPWPEGLALGRQTLLVTHADLPKAVWTVRPYTPEANRFFEQGVVHLEPPAEPPAEPPQIRHAGGEPVLGGVLACGVGLALVASADSDLPPQAIAQTLATLLGVALLQAVVEALSGRAHPHGGASRHRGSTSPQHNPATLASTNEGELLPALVSALSLSDLASLAQADRAHRAVFQRFAPRMVVDPTTRAGMRIEAKTLIGSLGPHDEGKRWAAWVDAQPLTMKAKVSAGANGAPRQGVALLRQAAAMLCSEIPQVRERCLHRLLLRDDPNAEQAALKFLERLDDTWHLVRLEGDGGREVGFSAALAGALGSPYGAVRRAAEKLVVRLAATGGFRTNDALLAMAPYAGPFTRGPWASTSPPPGMSTALKNVLEHHDRDVRSQALPMLLRFAWSAPMSQELVAALQTLALRAADPPGWHELMKEIGEAFDQAMQRFPQNQRDTARALRDEARELAGPKGAA